MKNFQPLNFSFENTWRLRRRFLKSLLWHSTLVLAIVSMTGCGLLEGLGPANEDEMATSVAQTVTAQAPPSATAAPASPTPEPTLTFTQIPAVPASDTPVPTLPVLPSLTPPPTLVFPTLAPTATVASCCTLKVWNRNQRVTYWIGLALTYGGNFIDPNHFVTFALSGKKWVRLYWCRRVDFKNWTPDSMDDFHDHWKNDLRFYCNNREIYVDQSVEEVIVQ